MLVGVWAAEAGRHLVDLRVKRSMRVERDGAGEVLPEGLLDGDPAAGRQARDLQRDKACGNSAGGRAR